ncbi:MAG: S41 family peptidase [Clostridiales bacterium]|nr:S41 family peptidase [Clostridiales bacterium]
MKRNRRIMSLLLALVLLLGLVPMAFAADSQAQDAAEALYQLGLFQGTGKNADGSPKFDLDRAPTRAEAVTMLVRLLGKETEVKSSEWDIPFTDVADWAKPYVGYAYESKLTNGVSETRFGGNQTVTAVQYLTFVLRALGYESGKDFLWNAAWELSDRIGLTDGQYGAQTTRFLRGDAAVISYNALLLCPNGQSVTLQEQITGTEPARLNFTSLLQQASQTHKEQNEGSLSLPTEYQPADPASVDLLTQDEIKTLLTPAYHLTPVLSEADAKTDADLLFRALRSAYGAYYMFGQDAFDAAEQQVLTWLEGKSSVTGEAFGEQLSKSLSFVRDAHFSVYDHYNERAIRYEYFYCEGQSYQLDGEVYYKYAGGRRWEFDSFSDARVRMLPSLTADGTLCYAPVLFCPATEKTDCTVSLTCGEESKTEPIRWIENTAFCDPQPGPDFRALEENGIFYISIRDFHREKWNFSDYIASAAQARKAKLVIYDLRTNGGGSDSFSRKWTSAFAGGGQVQDKACFANRVSALGKAAGVCPKSGRNGAFISEGSRGVWHKNDVPVIVLMDDLCGSAGESALTYIRTLDNVLVVGSNSSGYQLCGNVNGYCLPNSGIWARFGVSPQYHFKAENVDFKGYEPDVWCDPKTALQSVLNMMVRGGLCTADTADELRAALQPVITQENSRS